MKVVGAVSVVALVLADEQDSLGLLQLNKEASAVRQSDTLDCFAKKGGCGFTGSAETVPSTTTAAPRARPTRPQAPVTTTTVAPPAVPTAPVIGEMKASIPPRPTQKQVEDGYVCDGDKTKYREALTSYWEYEECGHFGNDYNAQLCGGIGLGGPTSTKGVCPEFWTPSPGDSYIQLDQAEQKYPGISAEMQCKKAKLEWFKNSTAWSTNAIRITGTRQLNYPQSITLKNCDPDCHYLWHAQYECVDPPMDQIGATTPTTPTTPTTTTQNAQAARLKAKKAANRAAKQARKRAAAAARKRAAAAPKKAAETLPKAFAMRLSPPAVYAHDHARGLSACTWNSKEMMKDCTKKDFFVFKGDVNGKYEDPSYSADVYGNDTYWRTFSAESEEEKWNDHCVAYAKTGGRTCKQWCKDVQNMECTRGMDDAHHQTRQLSQWLIKKGYKMDSRYGGCTLLPKGHSRKVETDNGCNQGWGTQICACK